MVDITSRAKSCCSFCTVVSIVHPVPHRVSGQKRTRVKFVAKHESEARRAPEGVHSQESQGTNVPITSHV
jgi:hypothetical protein